MGSINDYGRRRLKRGTFVRKEGAFVRRLLWQCAAAAVFLFLVGAGVGADNLLGDSARFVVQEVSAEGDSWLWDGEITPVSSVEGEPQLPETDADAQPVFTAPASGVVVTDLAVEASGFGTEQGILIQGTEGQNVKASADGEVIYLEEGDDGFVAEIRHSGGFCSVYQGLSAVSVASGDRVTLGQVIGTTDSGEITFSLLKDDGEVNPLEYLFE